MSGAGTAQDTLFRNALKKALPSLTSMAPVCPAEAVIILTKEDRHRSCRNLDHWTREMIERTLNLAGMEVQDRMNKRSGHGV
jgi:hypothetical protein